MDSADERPAKRIKIDEKRVKFAETIKLQKFDLCPYDIPFHEPVDHRTVNKAEDDRIASLGISVTPPESPREVELLVEDFHPELELPMKTFDGECPVVKASSALIATARRFPTVETAMVVGILRLGILTPEEANARLVTVHSRIVDVEEALVMGDSVYCGGYQKGLIGPDRLEPLRTVLKEIRELCCCRGVVLKSD